jgi:hypothetical protein
MLCIATASAQDNSLRFQRPGRAGESSATTSQQKFRAPSQAVAQPVKQPVVVEQVAEQPVARPVAKKAAPKKVAAKAPVQKAAVPIATKKVVKQPVRRDTQVRRAQSEELPMTTEVETWEEPVYVDGAGMDPSMQGDMMGGYPQMAMGPQQMGGCQCDSCMGGGVGCGMIDPGCGMMDPGCGCAEPSCGVAGCGDAVRPRGPDYWCFPVCLPRLKDISVWGGVHGFRGPRDFIPAGRSDSNFGFQEGINLSGRAPFLGFMFPELNYQLGYQALQSRLSGTETSTDSRDQQFITAGLFRRTCTGLQFGVVWDSMHDDLDESVSLHQVRYELSLKTPKGREIGFWGASPTNSGTSFNGVSVVEYETVGQYCGFYRWNFRGGNQGRIWGGGSSEGEGIVGADFYAPLNDRWSVQTGFNYLIPDEDAGPAGVSQESWNIGINLVWHWGRTAREGNTSPHRPLFSVADNGWMFVDRVQ